MKFTNIIENALDSTNLKRVKFKTDPKFSKTPEVADAYEGYVLEEQDGMLRIVMVSPDESDPCSAGIEDVEPAPGQTFEMFKQYVLKHLHDTSKCDHSEATHYNILQAGDLQTLEAYAKEQGLSNDEFINLTKRFLLNAP